MLASYNGLTNAITYDEDLRPTSIKVPSVEDLTFSYDNADRITNITNGLNGNLTQSFTYDPLSRLTAVTLGNNGGTASFGYDVDGNRTSKQETNGVTTNLSYAATNNRLQSSTTPHGQYSTHNAYAYDAQGNLTMHETYTDAPIPNPPQNFYYDGFNRLRQSYVGGLVTNYDVSAEGQRLRKSSVSGTTYFAPGSGGAMLAEYDSNGVWLDYVWLNGKLVTVVTSNGGVYPVHDDQTGRPIAMTNLGNQSVIWQANNWAFSTGVTTTTWFDFNIRFPGQYRDSESGLSYNGYRDYDPETGRYIESDPIGLLGGVNTYAYVGNSPVSLIDPLGLCDDHKCNKLERGLAIGAIDASKFADASGKYAKYLGGAAAGAAGFGFVTADPVVLGAAGGGAFAAGGVGLVSEATSVASGLLNTVASGGNFRYLGRAVLTSVVGGMVGQLTDKIPVFGPGLSTWASSSLESSIGSLQPLPPPCDVQ